jgi:molybdopterin-binding protein
MKLTARNILKGTIRQMVKGMVSTEVTVALPGGQEVVAVVTKSSADKLGLVEGKEVYAIVKASNVMIGVD